MMASCSPDASMASLFLSGCTSVGASAQQLVSACMTPVASGPSALVGSGKTMTKYGNVSVFDMGSSVVLKGVAACNVAARVLPTHRHQTAHPGLDDVGSPDTHDARRSESARSPWGSGAVGVFSFAHGTNGRFFCATEPHNSSQQG